MIESRDETQKDESSPTVKLIQVGVGVPVSYKVKSHHWKNGRKTIHCLS